LSDALKDDLHRAFTVSIKELVECINSLSSEELANFAKEVATKSLSSVFNLLNEHLERFELKFHYKFKIDVVDRNV